MVKRTALIAAIVALSAAVFSAPAAAQSGYDLFQKALALERADGNLRDAIQLYERVAKQFASDRALAARALVRIAECYEKLGQRDAAKFYERVVREFGDQADSVTVARARLSALQEPAVRAGQTVRQVWSGFDVDALGAPSPDGRFLTSVDWNTGDLVVRDLTQGTTRRVTNTGGWEASGDYAEFSVWSPDGRQIAYAWFVDKATPDGRCVCRYELRMIAAAGADPAAVHIVHRSADTIWIQPVAFTPDGRSLLVVRQHADRTHTLELMSVADGSPKVLKALGPHSAEGAALSPDGRYAAFAWTPDGDANHNDIFVITLADGSERPVVRHPANDRYPLWTSDGSQLMFVSDRTGAEAFWRVPFASGRGDGSPTMLMAAPADFWGLMGMTRAGALFYATGASNTNIYLTRLDANGNGASPQSVAIETYVNSNVSATWSPDGSSLAYLSRLGWGGGERAARVTVRTMATGRDRDIPLAVKPLDRVRWFPDGNSLLVTALDLQRQVAYYQVEIASGRATLLTTARGHGLPVRGPDISPDGKAIFFPDARDTSGGPWTVDTLMRFDLATRTTTPVFSYKGALTSFALSPDGARVAWLQQEANNSMVLRVSSLSGGEPRDLTTHRDLGPARFSGLAWSRDQRYVFYVKAGTSVGGSAELWKAPTNGGEPSPTGIRMNGMIRMPSVHPQDDRIVFAAQGGGTAPAIWVTK